MKKLLILLNFLLSLVFVSNTFGQYVKLLDFDGALTGRKPNGTLISDGLFLYGMTEAGGINDMGVVFKIKKDGTGYSKLLDFIGSNGSTPLGSLLFDGTYLYGMTQFGGLNDDGTIFKILPDGTGYIKLFDFVDTNGFWPRGSLIFDGIFLYGMTKYGGANNNGVIFKILPNGTGYTKLLDFSGTNGRNPCGDIVFDGTFLYGMTEWGGVNGLGTAFKIMPDGTGYIKLLDFAGLATGTAPLNNLIYDGTYLYGITQNGGINNQGVFFKILPDGTGFSKLFDFSGVTNGGYPQGALIFENSFLYGMASSGGINNMGTLFKIMPDGTGYNKLMDFAGLTTGRNPKGSLISDTTCIYGMTFEGGANDYGTTFKYCINTGILENNKDSELIVYPNPCVGMFKMKIKESGNILKVTNILGESIFQTITTTMELAIDLHEYPNGVYTIQVYTNKGETKTQKLIINK